MDFIKKYYNAIVGVAIMGIFVLGLTLSGSASGILASISDAVGGQQAQTSSNPSCVIPINLSPGSVTQGTGYVRVLQKFLNRMNYTVSNSGVGAPGQEYNTFDTKTKNALTLYQAANGIAPNNGYLGAVSRTNINSKLTAVDCAPNSPFYFRDVQGQYDSYDPGDKMEIKVDVVEAGDKSKATKSEGFNVQAYLYKGGANRTQALANVTPLPANPVGSYNAWFNTQTNQWEVNMNVPATGGDYLLKVVAYCSKTASYCDDKYGKGGEIKQVIPIRVSTIVTDAVSPLVDFVSAGTSIAAGTSTNDDQGTFTIKFRVTALEYDIYVSSLADAKLAGITTGKTSVVVDRNGVATIGGVSVALSNITDSSINPAGLYTIKAGESETFELTSTVQLPAAGKAGLFRAVLGGFSWGTSATDSTPNNVYTSNLGAFRTSYVGLN